MDLTKLTDGELLYYVLQILSKPQPTSEQDEEELALINEEFQKREEQ